VWSNGRAPRAPVAVSGQRLYVYLPNGFASAARIVRPARPNGRALIWHNGHESEANGLGIARVLAARGFLVVVMNMPMYGPSFTPLPVLELVYQRWQAEGDYVRSCGGWPPYGGHELFACYDHGLQYFVTPVVSVVNWLTRRGIRDVSMGGLSGGGWTTVVAAALDPRIKRSFSVAGSLPQRLFPPERFCQPTLPPLMSTHGCNLDWEGREVLKAADYDVLYLLAALERGRLHVGIWNQYDSDTFAGDYRHLWAPQVRQSLRRLRGGRVTALQDSQNRTHSVSATSIAWIKKRLR
jgi:hypothetical protein